MNTLFGKNSEIQDPKYGTRFLNNLRSFPADGYISYLKQEFNKTDKSIEDNSNIVDSVTAFKKLGKGIVDLFHPHDGVSQAQIQTITSDYKEYIEQLDTRVRTKIDKRLTKVVTLEEFNRLEVGTKLFIFEHLDEEPYAYNLFHEGVVGNKDGEKTIVSRGGTLNKEKKIERGDVFLQPRPRSGGKRRCRTRIAKKRIRRQKKEKRSTRSFGKREKGTR